MLFPHLFSSGAIGKCLLKNRIIMPLYPTKYATDSRVNQKMLEFYRARAKGGVGLIILDCPCLDYPRGFKGFHELRIDGPEYRQSIQRLLDAIHTEDAKAFMHLNYPKERSFDKEVAGAKKKGGKWNLPLANNMSLEDADEIIRVMAQGAGQARKIGYDGVEIQASYGGLIAQLLSPLLNKRDDELGSSLENRSRFLTRLISRVKQEAGRDYPVLVKLVCHEFVEGGLETDEAGEISALVEKAGADAIVANGGNKSTKHITIPGHESLPGPLCDLAAQMKSKVTIPVVAIGKINGPELAERVISDKNADFVALARPLIADPELPNKALGNRVMDIRGCVYCLEDCADKGVVGIGRCCSVNPFAGNEYRWQISPARKRKKVAVIGGGPSGIQAAVVASQRGHEVELWEQHQLGGQIRLADIAPCKEEMAEAFRYLEHSLTQSGVTMHMGHQAMADEIIAREPDVVIVACGSRPGTLSIPGINLSHVISARDLYEKNLPVGNNIIIAGGGELGCETADWLAGSARKVTVVEILPDVLGKMKKLPKGQLLARLSEKKVRIITETRLTSIATDTVNLTNNDGDIMKMEADTVILAINAEPQNQLVVELNGKVGKVVAVGDAASPGNLGSALRSATEKALVL
jgi:2,4-dienoyl-CoA reductase-like NADH-dependent reductase (Old Yellow Enzyme family)/thioredoxin reductase